MRSIQNFTNFKRAYYWELVVLANKYFNYFEMYFFVKMGQPRPLFRKQTIQFLKQINVKNVHPVYGVRIQIHDLSNMSRHP